MMAVFDSLFYKSNYPPRRSYISLKQYILQFVVKLIWFFNTLIAPCYFHGFLFVFPRWWAYVFTLGLFIVGPFAVNHWTFDAGET